jgi:hypothetical protein
VSTAKHVKGFELVKQTSRGIEPRSMKTLPIAVLVGPAKHTLVYKPKAHVSFVTST